MNAQQQAIRKQLDELREEQAKVQQELQKADSVMRETFRQQHAATLAWKSLLDREKQLDTKIKRLLRADYHIYVQAQKGSRAG